MARETAEPAGLRRQNEAAEPLDPMEDEAEDVVEDTEDDDDGDRRPKKKKAAPKKSKAARPSKPAARMRVVWAVVNDAFKVISTYEYSQKEAAETRAAELTAKGKGTHFVQRVKEAMPDDAPGLGAALTKTAPAAAAPAPSKPKAAVIEEEDEEAEIDEEEDEEPEEEEE